MNETDDMDNVPVAHDLAYFSRMREIAGQAGCAHVGYAYWVAAGYPEVHFGALCPTGLRLLLSPDHDTLEAEDLAGSGMGHARRWTLEAVGSDVLVPGLPARARPRAAPDS